MESARLAADTDVVADKMKLGVSAALVLGGVVAGIVLALTVVLG